MPKCYQLIGVPGSGKSTWIESQYWADKCVVVSTDKHVENFAKMESKTYSEVFERVMPKCVDLMADDVIKAREAGNDIIWDQTSTTVNSRRRKFNMLPDYYHVAIVFSTPNIDELNRRLNSRPGKVIPQRVVLQMIDGFEYPTIDEGFSEIWNAT